MPIRDVAGVPRLGMFEQVNLGPMAEATLTPVSGRGHYTNVVATGPDATSDAATTPVRIDYASSYGLLHAAEAAGAVRTPDPDWVPTSLKRRR